jgi:hypothetical protein
MVVKSPVFFKLALGAASRCCVCVVILRSEGVWGQIWFVGWATIFCPGEQGLFFGSELGTLVVGEDRACLLFLMILRVR